MTELPKGNAAKSTSKNSTGVNSSNRAPFPNLIPISSTSPCTNNVDQLMLQAQIKINTTAMQEIDHLKKTGNELQVQFDKVNKEREVLQAKYAQVLEQLQYLKRKVGSCKPSNENDDPNGGD